MATFEEDWALVRSGPPHPMAPVLALWLVIECFAGQIPLQDAIEGLRGGPVSKLMWDALDQLEEGRNHSALGV